MDHIITDSGLELRDGTIVMLVQFPGTRWVVKHGWYNYQGNQYTGWYFSSIPTQTCLPVTDEYLKMITVVNDNCGCKPPVCPPPFPPCPPPPSLRVHLQIDHISEKMNKRCWIEHS